MNCIHANVRSSIPMPVPARETRRNKSIACPVLIDADSKRISSTLRLAGSQIRNPKEPGGIGFSCSRQRKCSCRKRKWTIIMTRIKTLVAAGLISTISATSALAQAAIAEPGAFQAQFPNRDVLNGGVLTPAGRMGLELPGGASTANNAFAAMDSASPSFRAQRHSRNPARR
jgi:hypothetical protein